jgi:hypothetical protein
MIQQPQRNFMAVGCVDGATKDSLAHSKIRVWAPGGPTISQNHAVPSASSLNTSFLAAQSGHLDAIVTRKNRLLVKAKRRTLNYVPYG